MNGQIYQACCIVAAAKKALKYKSAISYSPLHYVNKIEFQFLPSIPMFMKPYKVENVAEWYDLCLKNGLTDIKYIVPIAVKDRNLLGFSNTSQSSIVCFYRDKVTSFVPRWEFNSMQKVWNILYTEYEWKSAPTEKPKFVDNTEDFKVVLSKIQDLADKINCNHFAMIFQKTIDILSGFDDYDEIIPLPEIPEGNLRLFKAASTADVFGAMGSWNDSPPFMAHEKGLDKEYESLSDELLTQVRLATLYAINAW